MILKWFRSSSVRHAVAMRRHVEKLLNHQRDILAPAAVSALAASIAETNATIAGPASQEDLAKQVEKLEQSANKWLKPYPMAAWRENVEVLLVALAIAMGIRTFFLQPFKIPTGSMQPTLFGVTSENLLSDPGATIPTGWQRVREWFAGASYVHVVAENDGVLEAIEPPLKLLIFNIKQTLWIGGRSYTIWFPPDYGSARLQDRAAIAPGEFFRKGQDVVKLMVRAGDHLFVDRMTYNFRPPMRGEIIVFETRGIEQLPQDQFYIKRLVALGGEKVQIGDDRHLRIDGVRLDASYPHFERVYSFNPKDPPRESHYSGHVNEEVVQQYYPNARGQLAPLFRTPREIYPVPPGQYMVMGDNTMNSLDSRTWGSFPASNVIGKAFFVYWPITDRFGWGYHR